jgi:MoaA/NifB/PqqE/SkfB family radical SAM enzyme
MNKTINTIHFDITEFCNYHCEYCYQGTQKVQKHISDTVYDNFFEFLSSQKEQFNVHLIGGEPFLYPRFFEMVQKVIDLGHKVSTTTNFSLPEKTLQKFLDITKGRISFWEISMHLTQIKDFEEFYEKLV